MSADQEVFDEGGPAEGLGEAWEEVPARWQCCFVAFSVDEPRAATRTSNPFAFAAAYLTLASPLLAALGRDEQYELLPQPGNGRNHLGKVRRVGPPFVPAAVAVAAVS